MERTDIAIVGGGLAGAVVAEEYRKAGGTADVTLLSLDTELPIHRPPLSKEYLRGAETRDNVFVHAQDYYDVQNIEVRLETRVDAVDVAEKHLRLERGDMLMFRHLVLATGARPRHLAVPGGDLPGVHYLRSLQSADALRAGTAAARRAVIVGAGFIGVEVAASLAALGVECTIVEVAPRIWSRLVPSIVSAAVRTVFEAQGVTFRFDVGVTAIEGNGEVQAVRLDDGTLIPCDLVVAGVGAELNIELARASGLDVDRGVVVDEYLRTSAADIYAVGDIASFPDPVGGRIHLEHWDNALHQGRAVGKILAGHPGPFGHIASFFSDLFDLSLNMVGYPQGWDDVVLRGDPATKRFTTIFTQRGVVRAALMVNDDTHFDTWTELVRERQVVRCERVLRDPAADPRAAMTAGPSESQAAYAASSVLTE